MNKTEAEAIEQLLAKKETHYYWMKTFYAENKIFYEDTLNYILSILNPPKGAVFLDAGCGSCFHSINLAHHGFYVQAIDISAGAIEIAKENVNRKGQQGKINIKRANILDLPFEKESFSYILCWGVLMHMPDLERAIAELTRVLKKGGKLIISEINMYSVDSYLIRKINNSKGNDVKKTVAGIEYRKSSPDGMMFTRHTNIPWLINQFRDNGFEVLRHIAGQFTEAYTQTPNKIFKKCIYLFNKLWFRYIHFPHLAVGNILILQRNH